MFPSLVLKRGLGWMRVFFLSLIFSLGWGVDEDFVFEKMFKSG